MNPDEEGTHPLATRKRTTGRWPLYAAQWSDGVPPLGPGPLSRGGGEQGSVEMANRKFPAKF